ncbi:MAG: hypothetical protein BZ135_01400 [Methanosphaera sp. rholeuAM6]|nr:MAG: hypothetical protein BZ135_01400 [Methanosphaera sp. rholeuAM6]
MINKDFFFFENPEYDIPFYRKKPRLTRNNLIILLIGAIIAFSTPYFIPVGQYIIPKALIITLSTLLPILYTLKGHLETIFRLPKKGDIVLIALGIIFYMALSILFSSALLALGIAMPVNNAVSSDNLITAIAATIQILGEELLKFIILVLVMAFAYKRTNRKNSLLCGIIVSQVLFALFHIPAYGFNLAFLLVSIGIASTILPIIYLITKNITVSYITHLLLDLIPLAFTVIGSSLFLML